MNQNDNETTEPDRFLLEELEAIAVQETVAKRRIGVFKEGLPPDTYFPYLYNKDIGVNLKPMSARMVLSDSKDNITTRATLSAVPFGEMDFPNARTYAESEDPSSHATLPTPADVAFLLQANRETRDAKKVYPYLVSRFNLDGVVMDVIGQKLSASPDIREEKKPALKELQDAIQECRKNPQLSRKDDPLYERFLRSLRNYSSGAGQGELAALKLPPLVVWTNHGMGSYGEEHQRKLYIGPAGVVNVIGLTSKYTKGEVEPDESRCVTPDNELVRRLYEQSDGYIQRFEDLGTCEIGGKNTPIVFPITGRKNKGLGSTSPSKLLVTTSQAQYAAQSGKSDDLALLDTVASGGHRDIFMKYEVVAYVIYPLSSPILTKVDITNPGIVLDVTRS